MYHHSDVFIFKPPSQHVAGAELHHLYHRGQEGGQGKPKAWCQGGTDLAGAGGGGRGAQAAAPSLLAHRSRRAARPCTASAAPSSPPRLRTPRSPPTPLPCGQRENCKIINYKSYKNEYSYSLH